MWEIQYQVASLANTASGFLLSRDRLIGRIVTGRLNLLA